MRKIVFASWNHKKTAEIQRMTPEGIKFVCLKDIPEAADVPQAEENGTTFKENATIKKILGREAQYACSGRRFRNRN